MSKFKKAWNIILIIYEQDVLMISECEVKMYLS
jgi:hypothetical protein